MIDSQEPWQGGRPHRRSLAVAALALLAVLAGCSAMQEMTGSSEQAAAAEPAKVSTAGAKDEFPNLAAVPSEPRAQSAPEDRERIMAEMAQDHAQATFSSTTTEQQEPAPLVTAAPPDPFATSVIISGDSVTTSDQVAGLPAPTAAGPGQLAAIIFFPNGSAALDDQDRKVLRDLARLREQRGGSLRIVGHASSWTQNATPEQHQLANFEMSLKRANAVLDELLQLGVPAEAAQAEAVGDAEPVYHEFMPSGEAGNRRVEIFLEN